MVKFLRVTTDAGTMFFHMFLPLCARGDSKYENIYPLVNSQVAIETGHRNIQLIYRLKMVRHISAHEIPSNMIIFQQMGTIVMFVYQKNKHHVLWKITMLNGKRHNFDWAMFSSHVSHYQKVSFQFISCTQVFRYIQFQDTLW